MKREFSASDDLISIIVPVYNVEKYLNRCVESILAQTFKNIEVILVENGSTDRSGEICDEYAQKDDRVTVIHTKDRDLAMARNSGLDIASGNYIGFVDSDDYIEPDIYERLYAVLTERGADISFCARYVEYKNKTIIVNWSKGREIIDLTGEQVVDIITRNSDLTVSVWDKLYRAELFSGVRFPPKKTYEDTYVTIPVLQKSSKICYLPIPLYHYTKRSGSLMQTDSFDFMMQAIEAKTFVRDFIREHYPDLTESADLTLTMEYVAALNRCLRSGLPVSPGLKSTILTAVRKDWLCWLKIKGVGIRVKAKVLLLRISFRLYCRAYVLWRHLKKDEMFDE